VKRTWGFLTNHALVLVYIIRHKDSTVRDISTGVGITERATLAILRELDLGGIVARHRDGRRNRYAVDFDRLAAYRREGTALLTPRIFIDGLIQVLLKMDGAGAADGTARTEFDSGALEPATGQWGFLTNQALLLLAVAQDNAATVRELAQSIGVTERAVVAILNQMEEEGIVVRNRQGRRNSYAIDFDAMRRFPRWSTGAWPLPPELVEMAVQGLRALALHSGSGDSIEATSERPDRRPHPLSLEWSGGGT
jgi:DNA-binding MarR family transcriptional regulator